MSNGSDIAAQIAAAFAEGSSAVGDGPLVAVISRQTRTGGSSFEPEYETAFYPFNAVILQFSAMEQQASGIPITDVKINLSVGAIEPGTGDLLILNNQEEYDIQKVWPKKPGGVVLSWTAQASKT